MPVGPHITDIVSFPLRMAIELVPASESEEAVKLREERVSYLRERGYRVVELPIAEVEADVGHAIERVFAATAQT